MFITYLLSESVFSSSEELAKREDVFHFLHSSWVNTSFQQPQNNGKSLLLQFTDISSRATRTELNKRSWSNVGECKKLLGLKCTVNVFYISQMIVHVKKTNKKNLNESKPTSTPSNTWNLTWRIFEIAQIINWNNLHKWNMRCLLWRYFRYDCMKSFFWT